MDRTYTIMEYKTKEGLQDKNVLMKIPIIKFTCGNLGVKVCRYQIYFLVSKWIYVPCCKSAKCTHLDKRMSNVPTLSFTTSYTLLPKNFIDLITLLSLHITHYH